MDTALIESTPSTPSLRSHTPTVVAYLAGLDSPRTRQRMAQALNVASDLLTGGQKHALETDWGRLQHEHIAALRTQLCDRYAPAGVNLILSAIKGVLKTAWRQGLIGAEHYHRVTDIHGVKGQPLPPGRALSTGEISALFDACGRDVGPAAVRDAAILALLYAAGLRRSELVNLDYADYDQDTGELKIRRGKGRKDRIGYAANGSKDALEAWLAVRGITPGPLFIRIRKGGRIIHQRLSDHAVWEVTLRRATQAKIKPFAPHDMRRTFISHLLEHGADLSVVQRMAGHSQISTTARYDHRGLRAQREAAQLLHVPFRA